MKFWKERRRSKLHSQRFPPSWEDALRRLVPLYNRLPAADQTELHSHIQVLLDEKQFEGCGGLVITDDIRLTIGAQAAVLLLHRETDYFPSLSSILVYPSTYVATGAHAEDGIVTEFEEERAGETWSRGSLVLSWNDVTSSVGAAPASEHPDSSAHRAGNGGPREDAAAHAAERVNTNASDTMNGVELVPAYNVVLHEFAHQLDEESGEMDGVPRLQSREAYEKWIHIMETVYDELRARHSQGKDLVIDEYGLEDPAEFFAVVTESFFETPFAVIEEHPTVYETLKSYYCQDPVKW